MSSNEIWIEKDGRRTLLGPPAYDPRALLQWSGLSIGRLNVPRQHTDRHIFGTSPIVSMLVTGRAHTRLRIASRSADHIYKPGSLMLYRGAIEIDRADWRTEGLTEVLSVELNPARLHALGCPVDSPSLASAPHFQDPALASLVAAMWRELHNGCPDGPLHAEALSMHLTTHLYARAPRWQAHAPAQGLSESQRRRVDEYLYVHLGQPIALQDLANAAGLSRFHFARMFRMTYGTSAHQHVIALRVQRAQSLLEMRALSVAEVALACGFSSQSHLTSTCRRVLGATPARLQSGLDGAAELRVNTPRCSSPRARI